MAKEYIERAKVTDALIDNTSIVGGELEEAVNAICAIPAADVRPVVRGRWVEDGDNQPMSCDKCYCCSNCHGNRRFEWQLKPFCEDCGAYMREVDDED